MAQYEAICITGGTGFLGRHLAAYACEFWRPKRCIVFSRDEHKQREQRERAGQWAERLRWFIGDIRDYQRLLMAFRGVDLVVHAAALKDIVACEYNPSEAVQTNVQGTDNVVRAAVACGVKCVVYVSTDKAVHPVNLYGKTKACAERLALDGNFYAPIFRAVRYGNVMGSTGSVVELFQRLALNPKKPLPVTDPTMTRFWTTLDDAIHLVEAATKAPPGSLLVGNPSAVRMRDLADAMAGRGQDWEEVGPRPGEKKHETLIGEEELPRAHLQDTGYFLIHPEIVYLEKVEYPQGGKVEGLTSDLAPRLNKAQIRERVENLTVVRPPK